MRRSWGQKIFLVLWMLWALLVALAGLVGLLAGGPPTAAGAMFVVAAVGGIPIGILQFVFLGSISPEALAAKHFR